jgi:hypothetical protein
VCVCVCVCVCVLNAGGSAIEDITWRGPLRPKLSIVCR